MRFLAIVALCAALGGCWTSGQEAANSNRAGEQFVGQNIDAVVARFGKPLAARSDIAAGVAGVIMGCWIGA